MDRRLARKLAVVAAGAGMAVAFTAPSAAVATPSMGTADTPDSAVSSGAVDAASPEMLAAMQRDLGLSADQARALGAGRRRSRQFRAGGPHVGGSSRLASLTRPPADDRRQLPSRQTRHRPASLSGVPQQVMRW